MKYEVVFQFKVPLKLHIHEEYDNFIWDKSPHFCMFSQSSLHSLDFGCNAVVFYTVACFSVFRMTFSSQCLSYLREEVSIHQTNLKYCGKSPKIRFLSNFHILLTICSNNSGVVFLRKYILVFER